VSNFVFGPVPSRRLGYSLGVDIIPHKYCNFDCIYCQIGRTTEKNATRKTFFHAEEVAKQVVDAIYATEKVDFITFSGSREPTLNKNLGTMIREIKKKTITPVAVITNSSLFDLKEVRRDLIHADVVLPSLDASSDKMLQRINRPQTGIHIKKIIEGIRRFRKEYSGLIWLEIMFIKGMNDTGEELRKLFRIVNDLDVDKIHLNTVTRPPSEANARPISREELEQIRKIFGDRCEVISSFEKDGVHHQQVGWAEELVEVLKRRALTLHDIIKITGIASSKIQEQLRDMKKNGLIEAYRLGKDIYYNAVDR